MKTFTRTINGQKWTVNIVELADGKVEIRVYKDGTIPGITYFEEVVENDPERIKYKLANLNEWLVNASGSSVKNYMTLLGWQ